MKTEDSVIQHTYINCDTGFWVIDTQEVARITWRPDDDTFEFDDDTIYKPQADHSAIYTREEMTAILESEQMRHYIDSWDIIY
jgi:hypothetical protein